jgi:hypothetical protein
MLQEIHEATMGDFPALSRAERAALAIIVNSGRPFVEAGLLTTEADDGRRVFTGHYHRPQDGSAPVARCSVGPGPAAGPVTAAGLAERGYVALWRVGVVKVIDHDNHRKWGRPALLATLTPLGARLLGVRLTAAGGVVRWTAGAGGDGPPPCLPSPRRPGPPAFPELAALRPPRSRRSRAAPAPPA